MSLVSTHMGEASSVVFHRTHCSRVSTRAPVPPPPLDGCCAIGRRWRTTAQRVENATWSRRGASNPTYITGLDPTVADCDPLLQSILARCVSRLVAADRNPRPRMASGICRSALQARALRAAKPRQTPACRLSGRQRPPQPPPRPRTHRPYPAGVAPVARQLLLHRHLSYIYSC